MNIQAIRVNTQTNNYNKKVPFKGNANLIEKIPQKIVYEDLPLGTKGLLRNILGPGAESFLGPRSQYFKEIGEIPKGLKVDYVDAPRICQVKLIPENY